MMMNLKNEAKLQSIFLLNNFWQERNAVREGGQRRPAESLAMLSWRQAAEMKNFKHSGEDTTVSWRRRGKWQRPLQGNLKVNVDGAYCEQDMKGGWGYVIRNEEGRVIQSGAGCKQFACNAMHMELIA